jgi:hypothetical protein
VKKGKESLSGITRNGCPKCPKFSNNLRINKPEGLTREELHDYYRQQRNKKAAEYQKMIEENGWSKADLARHLGVSRAWVTIVMRELE